MIWPFIRKYIQLGCDALLFRLNYSRWCLLNVISTTLTNKSAYWSLSLANPHLILVLCSTFLIVIIYIYILIKSYTKLLNISIRYFQTVCLILVGDLEHCTGYTLCIDLSLVKHCGFWQVIYHFKVNAYIILELLIV